jgi:hypothetical protein
MHTYITKANFKHHLFVHDNNSTSSAAAKLVYLKGTIGPRSTHKNDVAKGRHLAVPGHVDYPLRKVVRPEKKIILFIVMVMFTNQK